MINSNFKFIAFLLLMLVCSPVLKAQNVYFSYSDGTNGTYSLSDMKRMTFNNSIMNLDLNDGTSYQWNISDIVSFRYNEVTSVGAVLQGLNGLDVKLFPNPNSGSFQLAYNLPKQTNIEVSIYSIDGKLIKTLYKGQQSAGEQLINAALTEIPKGIYTCRLEADGFSVNKKMIVN
jgi:hypothetical protein